MDAIDRAFKKVRRKDFLPEDVKHWAEWDIAVPIGFGKTNSQPFVVESMLRWLDPQPGDKVLDIGSGSGWTTALLAQLVGPRGKVYALERIPELLRMGREHCRQAGVRNANFLPAAAEYGLPEMAPFDRILVSATAENLPEELVDQLKPDGRIVLPVRTSLLEVEKTAGQGLEIIEHPGFIFVPLV